MSVRLGTLAKGLPDGFGEVLIEGITADSRLVRPGYLFAAMSGTRQNGMAFVQDALGRGASAVLGGPDDKVSLPGNVPYIADENPRVRLAVMAASFYHAQPDIAVAVTGTNGKTSVVSFVRQLWQAMGLRAASMGTIGVVGPSGKETLAHTTPDPVRLHETLARLAIDHTSHVALEASSHGLAQHRLDAVRLTAGAFLNLSRDHLDYHSGFEDYFDAKMRLFRELLTPEAAAVINVDSKVGRDVEKLCRERGLRILSVGERGTALRLVSHENAGFGQNLQIAGQAGSYEIYLPLAGSFQAANALAAAGLVIAAGGAEDYAIRSLEMLKGAKGRLDLVATARKDAPVFVDYAHTPDALEQALCALRPYVTGRLVVAFGCGGDRDRGKRGEMGKVAARLADVVYVTDDNPRSEDPAAIRAEALKGCPDAIEIGDRATAIRQVVASLRRGDVALIAGKGHEDGQTIGDQTVAFSDHDEVAKAVAEAG